MAETNGCCDDAQVIAGNPKADRKKKRKSFHVISTLPDPIPNEVADASEIKKFFEKWNFVPYATANHGSGHTLLVWYLMLGKMSPTHAACMTKKCTYAFGSAPSTIRAKNPEFDTGAELVAPSLAEKQAYEQALTQFVTWSHPIRQFHRLAGMYYQTTGNAWIELSVSSVLGQTRAHIRLHQPLHTLYVNTDPGEPLYCAISPVWRSDYLDKNPPRIVPLYPGFSQDTDGTLHTMFHLRDGANTWYGRPASMASDLNKYSEVQATYYRIRNAHGEFSGRIVLEFEEENPTTFMRDQNLAAQAAGYESAVDRFQEQYTQAGDNPQGMLVMTRAFGAKPMGSLIVPPNNSQGYFKGIGEIDANQILVTHQCTKRFMSFDVATGFAQDAYLEDYVINMEPVINDFRETVLIFTNKVLSVVWALTGQQDLDKQSIWFDAPISSQIEQYKKRSEGGPQPINGNQPDPTDPTDPTDPAKA